MSYNAASKSSSNGSVPSIRLFVPQRPEENLAIDNAIAELGQLENGFSDEPENVTAYRPFAALSELQGSYSGRVHSVLPAEYRAWQPTPQEFDDMQNQKPASDRGQLRYEEQPSR